MNYKNKYYKYKLKYLTFKKNSRWYGRWYGRCY